MHREKGRWELYKNSRSYFEQILDATPLETTAVWSLTSHLKNNPIKTKKTGCCWRSAIWWWWWWWKLRKPNQTLTFSSFPPSPLSLSLSLAISSYWPSLPTGLPHGIQCLYRADEYKFLLVGQCSCVRV